MSDAPPTSAKQKQTASSGATFAAIGALVFVLAVASWVLLR